MPDQRTRLLGIIGVGERPYENSSGFNYLVMGTITPKIVEGYDDSNDRARYASPH